LKSGEAWALLPRTRGDVRSIAIAGTIRVGQVAGRTQLRTIRDGGMLTATRSADPARSCDIRPRRSVHTRSPACVRIATAQGGAVMTICLRAHLWPVGANA
jgi:hypothetical protein